MAIGDIKTKEYLIRQWVLWAYESRGIQLYFPPVTNFAKMRPRKAKGLCITDDEGQELDSVVSRMMTHNQGWHTVFTLYHLAGYPLRDIAASMGHRDHKKIKHQLDLAESFFELMTLGPQSGRECCSVATP